MTSEERARIVRLYGTADAYILEYTKGADGRWRASVPPDMEDGQYAVELHAITEFGTEAAWTGILYMRRGKAKLVLKEKKILFNQEPLTLINELDVGPSFVPDGFIEIVGLYGGKMTNIRIREEVCTRL